VYYRQVLKFGKCPVQWGVPKAKKEFFVTAIPAATAGVAVMEVFVVQVLPVDEIKTGQFSLPRCAR
jgi:hypothetical protein